MRGLAVNILVVDVGGTNVKVWKTGEADSDKFSSGKKLTPQRMVEQVKAMAGDWPFDRVSIGYPGDVVNGRPSAEPHNLAPGWVEFDWSKAFACPLRIMNDACMQALGSYEGGKMLYLGLGTGIGTAFITDWKIIPLALGHLQFRDGGTFDSFLSSQGLTEHGAKRWREAASEAGQTLKRAFVADYVVFGGGNARKLKELPEGCRSGGNHNAYFGGLRMWDDAPHMESSRLTVFDEAEPRQPLRPGMQSGGAAR